MRTSQCLTPFSIGTPATIIHPVNTIINTIEWFAQQSFAWLNLNAGFCLCVCVFSLTLDTYVIGAEHFITKYGIEFRLPNPNSGLVSPGSVSSSLQSRACLGPWNWPAEDLPAIVFVIMWQTNNTHGWWNHWRCGQTCANDSNHENRQQFLVHRGFTGMSTTDQPPVQHWTENHGWTAEQLHPAIAMGLRSRVEHKLYNELTTSHTS